MGEQSKAPDHLSDEMKSLWSTIVDEYELESHHVVLLRLALEARDRAEEARTILEREGLQVEDRFGQARAHPMAQVRKEAENAFARLMVHLDLEGDSDPAKAR